MMKIQSQSVIFLCLALGIAFISLNFTSARLSNENPDSPPRRSILVQYGEMVFKRENCIRCHTLREENASENRISIDGYGSKRSDAWVYKYLQHPKSMIPESTQKGYPHLFNTLINEERMRSLVDGNSDYKDVDPDILWLDLEEEAFAHSEKIREMWQEYIDETEIVALIAFLQNIPETESKKRLDSIQFVEFKNEYASVINLYEDADSLVSNALKSKNEVKMGKALFSQNCSICHNSGATGVIGSGPSLIDSESLYGDDYQTMVESIMNGRTGGMPKYQSRLAPSQIVQVVAYIAFLKKHILKEGD